MSASPAACPPHPRCDRAFIDRCIWDLVTHAGEWRQLGRLYAAHVPSFDRCCMVREAVDWGRRVGFEIEGDRRRGYRVTGYRHPERIYRIKPGRESQSESDAQLPGQLVLVRDRAPENGGS